MSETDAAHSKQANLAQTDAEGEGNTTSESAVTNSAIDNPSGMMQEADKAQEGPEDEDSTEKENLGIKEQAGKAWNAYLKANDSIITDLFAGLLMSAVECQTCHNVTRSFEPFLDLSVAIPRAESKSLLQKTLRATGGSSGQATLDGCLSQYTASEKLDDLVTCEKCKQKKKGGEEDEYLPRTKNFGGEY